MSRNTIPVSPGAPKLIELPTDWRIYINEILDRCEALMHYQVWGGLHVTRLRAWMANFLTDEEKYFAACILDFMIYRPEDQTVALIKQLFQRVLSDLSRIDPIPAISSVVRWEQAFRLAPPNDPKARIVVVVKGSDPPTKSAHLIVRLMKRNLCFNETWIIRPQDIQGSINSGAKAFFFVDDFIGTGDQFRELVTTQALAPVFTTNYCAYLPLVGHLSGITTLRSTFPNLRVSAVETLDNSHSVFHAESSCFKDGKNTPEMAKRFYLDLLRNRGINYQNGLGYGGLELALAFSHACPDNSLPILWWNKTPSWNPLFDR